MCAFNIGLFCFFFKPLDCSDVSLGMSGGGVVKVRLRDKRRKREEEV